MNLVGVLLSYDTWRLTGDNAIFRKVNPAQVAWLEPVNVDKSTVAYKVGINGEQFFIDLPSADRLLKAMGEPNGHGLGRNE